MLASALVATARRGLDYWGDRPDCSWEGLGPTLQRLRADLNRALSGLPFTHRQWQFELSMVGWLSDPRWPTRRSRSFVMSLRKDKGANQVARYVLGPGNVARRKDWLLRVAPTENQALVDHDGLLASLGAATSQGDVYRALVDAARQASRRDPGRIGTDIMAVGITPPHWPDRLIEVRFSPESPTLVQYAASIACSSIHPGSSRKPLSLHHPTTLS